MGRGIKKNLRAGLFITLLIIILSALVVIAGCDTGMLDDIEDKIAEDEAELSAKDLPAPFAFLAASNAALSADVFATITGTAISATVPYGTDVTALVATFITTGASVKVGDTTQVSGTTVNNFTSPVTYRVTAEDGTFQDFIITVIIASSSAKDLTAFIFPAAGNAALSADVVAAITDTNISATVPYGTNVTALTANFSTTGVSVTVDSTTQVSGTTVNNFTNPVTYRVTAQDSTYKDYTVTVVITSSSANDLTQFFFLAAGNDALSADVVATITGTNISATVPYGTDVTALVVTFITTGVSVTVNDTSQISGTTANNFTSPVTYRVTAENGSPQDYVVTVNVASGSANDLTSFFFLAEDNSELSADVVATIAGTDISATVPYGTDRSALTASFSTTGVSVTVSGTTQVSGVTVNNFTNTVTYRVTAGDGSPQDYVVTVTVALDIYSFVLDVATDGSGSGSINTTNSTADGNYNTGTSITAQATIDTGSLFVGWYNAASGGTEISTDNPYNFSLSNNTALYAKFDIIPSSQYSFALDVATDGSGSGTINTTNSTANGSYDSGTSVIAWATVDSGSQFAGWYDAASGGELVSGANPYPFSLNMDTSLFARFDLDQYSFALDATTDSTGSGSIDTDTSTADGTYNSGSYVVAQAIIGYGSSFTGWFDTATGGTGTPVSIDNPYVFTLNADTSLYAKWTLGTYTVTFNEEGGAAPSPPSKVVTYSETYGTLATTNRMNHTFAGWWTETGGTGNEVTASTTVTATSDHTLYAKWAEDFTITFNKDDAGAEGTMDDQTIGSGLSENLTANTFTKTGWAFAGWATTSGGTVEYADQESYTMGTANETLYAQWLVVYAIGDTGPSEVGIVFYITDGGIHGLEAATSDQSENYVWIEGGSTQSTENGNTSIDIGTGSANTDAIIAQDEHTASAAQVCRDYTGGSLNDWFLPSKDELNEMYGQKEAIGGFADDNYWSSSEVPSYNARFQDFGWGNQNYGNKNNNIRVRAVRAF